MLHNSAVELASPLFRRKRKRGDTGSRSSAGLQPFSIVGRRYSAGSYRRLSPFFSDRFERRGLVYVGSSIQHKTASDAVFAEYNFIWDAGNRITEFETVDGTAEYTYDKTGQLTGADYDYITDELYTYDNNGNRTNAGYVTGDNNETLSDGTYRYSYDAEGNRTEKFLWNDTNNDGIIDDSEKTLVQTFEWDYRNRLSSVTNYENGIAKEIIDYLYDYLNLMIERTVTDAATSILQSSDFNIYSNGQIILEYDTTSSVDVVKSINLWGANIDELVAVEQMAQSVNDSNVILWTYGDYLNSIRDVVLYDSIAQTAAVVNHIIYNAFGVLVSSTDGNLNNPTAISPLLKFRYTGKFFDDSTGLQNNINRWYDNTTGRWLSTDPIEFNGGDVNLYRYVGNSVKKVDYLGTDSYSTLDKPYKTGFFGKVTPPDAIDILQTSKELKKDYSVKDGILTIEINNYALRFIYKPARPIDDIDESIMFIQIAKVWDTRAYERVNPDEAQRLKQWHLDGAGDEQDYTNVENPFWKSNNIPWNWNNRTPVNNGIVSNGKSIGMYDSPGTSGGGVGPQYNYHADFYTAILRKNCDKKYKESYEWIAVIHWSYEIKITWLWGNNDYKLSIYSINTDVAEEIKKAILKAANEYISDKDNYINKEKYKLNKDGNITIGDLNRSSNE
ncbi:MAG: RHS repeat-associated core domain-containing protein [Thermoguttaceae bacterium]|nr:RHS repeat-associated core domain-containing protein [Thermoguttaceae bacterium]